MKPFDYIDMWSYLVAAITVDHSWGKCCKITKSKMRLWKESRLMNFGALDFGCPYEDLKF
jgi:hypothetical protein